MLTSEPAIALMLKGSISAVAIKLENCFVLALKVTNGAVVLPKAVN